MNMPRPVTQLVLAALFVVPVAAQTAQLNKRALRDQAKEMFMHAYGGYKRHAFLADELMPISCAPRIRGRTRSRGDVDDALGNFSLTLVDSLDTLAVLGELDEFEHAAAAVVRNVRFDSDLVVSVFETNIRMVGGLISGHLMCRLIQEREPTRLTWYSDQLLRMAADLADRLLPAFNTTSGVPYSKVNLKSGMSAELRHQSHTCTACAGTLVLEWAALSRLTGNPVYEEKARKSMDFLWNQRNHGSDLMGTVLNVHSGDWIRRDAGIGAGIDSYYEYTLKMYILLGEEDYLYRFNKHYDAVMRYLNKGPLFVDVHMHRPTVAAKSYMDSLLAFWPGVQVLKGDLKGAIEMHEMLYQVIKKHKFLPEAFTHDLQVYWAQHPLRPEFLESTYLLYRATKDAHYLEVARSIMDSMNQHVRVQCGFAALKDVRSMELLDEMESFVLAETFKYLYLIFAEPADLLFDPDNYVLTTEAHFIPLAIAEARSPDALPRRMLIDPDEVIGDDTAKKYQSACPNFASEFRTSDELSTYGLTLRGNVKKVLSEITTLGSFAPLYKKTAAEPLSDAEVQKKAGERLRAWAFSSTNADHIQQLKRMGIQVHVMPDGRMQLSHMAQDAADATLALQGVEFMQEMIELSKNLEKVAVPPRFDPVVQIVSEPVFGLAVYGASPAQFGMSLEDAEVSGEVSFTDPSNACQPLTNVQDLAGRVAIVRRGDCMFQDKVRHSQNAGAVGVIVIDNQRGTSAHSTPMFAMSADGRDVDDLHIPALFLFDYEAQKLQNRVRDDPRLKLSLSVRTWNPAYLFELYARGECCRRRPLLKSNEILAIDPSRNLLRIDFRFKSHVKPETDALGEELEEQTRLLQLAADFADQADARTFHTILAQLAHHARLRTSTIRLSEADSQKLRHLLRQIRLKPMDPARLNLRGRRTTTLICRVHEQSALCEQL